MKRSIKIKTVLPFSPELVWRALTTPAVLGSWFMENDIKAVPGAEFQFRMAPQKGWDGITHCEVMEVEPLKKIAYTYRGEASGEKALACAGIHSDKADEVGKGFFTKLDTLVTFELSPTCGGTLLTLRQEGYKGFLQVIVSFIMQMGWKKQLTKKLPAALKVLSEKSLTAS